MEIFDLKEKTEYVKEVIELEHLEWADNPEEDKLARLERKIKKFYDNVDDIYFCKLILLDNDKLVGFISIFPYDSKKLL